MFYYSINLLLHIAYGYFLHHICDNCSDVTDESLKCLLINCISGIFTFEK
nr:MAG TPA: hypothetical protein [Caudoviricetes sp.]